MLHIYHRLSSISACHSETNNDEMLISLNFAGHHFGENKDLWRASNWLFPQTGSDIEYFIPQLISKDESHGPTTHKSFRKCNSILCTGKEEQKLFG